MATIKRLIKALKDYFTKGEVGDIAFLKFEVFGLGANSKVLAQLEDFAGYYPSINLEQLSQLPQGTLGYEYAQHMHKYGIQPLEISQDLREEADSHLFALRYTVTHDIFHVLLGFDTSYAGEMGVFAFTIAQNYSKMINALEPLITFVYPFIFINQAKQMREYVRKGKALGKKARCLLTYRFEDNWARDLADILNELGLVLEDDKLDTEVGSQPQGTVAA